MILLEDERLATASTDHKIKIWNYKTGTCDFTFSGYFIVFTFSYHNPLVY